MTFELEIQNIKVLFAREISSLLKEIDFGKELIEEAEKRLNLKIGYNYFLFPEGEASILLYVESILDLDALSSVGPLPKKFRISETIGKLLQTRIKNLPKEMHRRILSYYLAYQPIAGFKATETTCDCIWRYLGDESDDYNYYSKRALLASVYTASRLFFIQDLSEGFKDTDLFIDKSLKATANLTKLKKKLDFDEIMGKIPFVRLFT